jgi:hypothetical protein
MTMEFKEKPIVIVESPYAGDVELNTQYARAAATDCLKRGEAPYISHLLYTQPGILDDTIPEERKLGMEAGWSFIRVATKTVVYTDMGISSGMKQGIEIAEKFNKEIEYRSLDKNFGYVK